MERLYDRAEFVAFGNVVEVTQGTSVINEVLGDGDGSVPFQSFLLADAP